MNTITKTFEVEDMDSETLLVEAEAETYIEDGETYFDEIFLYVLGRGEIRAWEIPASCPLFDHVQAQVIDGMYQLSYDLPAANKLAAQTKFD